MMLFQMNRKAAKLRRSRLIQRCEERDYESPLRHSNAYHRFFEGYCEGYAEKAEGGRRKIVRTYVGSYYKRDCSDRAWLGMKISYVVIYLSAALLYLYALVQPVAGNSVWYAALPGLLSAIPMLLLASKILACIVSHRVMVAYDYKQVFCRIFPYCAVAAAFLSLTAMMALLCMILNPQARGIGDFLPILGCLSAAALVFVIGRTELNAQYIRIENSNVPRENDVIIQEEL